MLKSSPFKKNDAQRIIMKIEDAIKQTKPFRSDVQKLVVNIMYTSGWLESDMIRRLKPFDLSPQQYNILRILRGKYPESACTADVASRMLYQNSNVTRIVDKLLTKELLTREVNKVDRRFQDLKITQKGLDLLDLFEKETYSWEEYFKDIDPELIRKMSDGLDLLRSQVEEKQ
jgi:DNA-binding MarR family transcriptional regulator